MRGGARQRGGIWVRAILVLVLLSVRAASVSSFSNATFLAASANRTEISSAADWVPPSISLLDPGPAIRGTVILSANASDPYGSGVASVRIERAAAGSGNWTAICTDAGAPYSCELDTTALAGDYYDFRAVATDNTGFSSTDSIAAAGKGSWVDVCTATAAPYTCRLDTRVKPLKRGQSRLIAGNPGAICH